jgi:hypothetical protein
LVGWYSIETMCGQPVVVAMRSRRQIVHRNETRKRERFPASGEGKGAEGVAGGANH